MSAYINRLATAPQRTKRVILACSLILFFLVGGCAKPSTLHDDILVHLEGKGPVAVISDNPFLASSVLLSKEIESSPELAGFVRHRGEPKAFEVVPSESGGTAYIFYYPDTKEQYLFEHSNDGYIISGPFPIAADKLAAVTQLATASITVAQPSPEQATTQTLTTQSPAPTPKQHIEAKVTTPKPTPVKAETPKPSLEPVTEKEPEPNYPTAKLTVTVKSEESTNKASESKKSDSLEAKEQSRAKEASAESPEGTTSTLEEVIREHAGSEAAETTPKGDLVHFVTFQGETLSIIARWYTLDLNNAQRLARINKLKDANGLSLGDQIVIPSYLVKNKARLTSQGLQAIIRTTSR